MENSIHPSIHDIEYRNIRSLMYDLMDIPERKRTIGLPHERKVIKDIDTFLTETRTCKRIDDVKLIQPTEKQKTIIQAVLHGLSFQLIAVMLDSPILHVELSYSVIVQHIAEQIVKQLTTQVSE